MQPICHSLRAMACHGVLNTTSVLLICDWSAASTPDPFRPADQRAHVCVYMMYIDVQHLHILCTWCLQYYIYPTYYILYTAYKLYSTYITWLQIDRHHHYTVNTPTHAHNHIAPMYHLFGCAGFNIQLYNTYYICINTNIYIYITFYKYVLYIYLYIYIYSP